MCTFSRKAKNLRGKQTNRTTQNKVGRGSTVGYMEGEGNMAQEVKQPKDGTTGYFHDGFNPGDQAKG
eukprot:495812-Ditylum_brightwellii.AAC.1